MFGRRGPQSLEQFLVLAADADEVQMGVRLEATGPQADRILRVGAYRAGARYAAVSGGRETAVYTDWYADVSVSDASPFASAEDRSAAAVRTWLAVEQEAHRLRAELPDVPVRLTSPGGNAIPLDELHATAAEAGLTAFPVPRRQVSDAGEPPQAPRAGGPIGRGLLRLLHPLAGGPTAGTRR